MATPPKYVTVTDGPGLGKIKWSDKNVRTGHLKSIVDDVNANSNGHLGYLQELKKECDAAVKILSGIEKQLEAKPDTKDFKIEGAKKLRDQVKLALAAAAADMKAYSDGMLGFRGAKLTMCVDNPDALKALEKTRAAGQDKDKIADGLDKGIVAAEAQASGLMKQISARAGGYGSNAAAGAKFKEKADSILTKYTSKFEKQKLTLVLRAKNALALILKRIAEKDFKLIGSSMMDVIKNEQAFSDFRASAEETFKTLGVLQVKCPDPVVQADIISMLEIMRTEAKWYETEATVIIDTHTKVEAIYVKTAGARKGAEKFPDCSVK